MGNSQAAAVKAAEWRATHLEIQLPKGMLKTFCQTLSVSQATRFYPGHQVALLIYSAVPHRGSPRVTNFKILGPSDNLLLGNDYRLFSSKEMEVIKVTKKVKVWKPAVVRDL